MSPNVVTENPNEITGGGGCACHPRRSDETRGPFLVFPATTTDDNLSPHVVVCQHCVCNPQFIEGTPAEEIIEIAPEDIEELPEI